MRPGRMVTMVMVVALLGLLAGGALQPSQTYAESKPIEITFSTYWPTSYGYLWEPIVSFAQKVEKQSKGRIKFKLYHTGQLFKGKEEFAALARGDIDMSAPLDIYNTGIVAELGISSLPFMWEKIESLQKSLDAGLWDLGINQKLLKHNVVVLGVAAGGPYQFYTKKKPILQPDDMKGLKFGVSGSTASKATELLGGSPTTMSSGELYMALQRGTIDGCTRPTITGIGRKLYEVVKHFSVANMYYYCSFLSVNKRKWDSLPGDIREIMKKVAKERDQEQVQKAQEFIKKGVELYKEKGVEVHILSSTQLAKFKEKMEPVYAWWLKKVPTGNKYIEFVKAHH
ncbi:MAG: TRAP transporter substrate-binding protein DctP [Deltaproteobacteria bacterium]|nr:TRAP transporter substrate-binding protein DctP [Deltaproteobacteria bacterium]MBW2307296.1 TRAP transporter substrate-binding protein DctP [Deltaproteobacteria bacterium]